MAINNKQPFVYTQASKMLGTLASSSSPTPSRTKG